MVFSSLTFLFFFLPASIACYYAFPQRWVRNLILTFFSLLFYAWGEPIWVLLLIFSVVVDFFIGLFIEHFRERKAIARIGLVISLMFNLGLLISLKYFDFLVEITNALTGLTFEKPGILLPVGISFYTFQSISYIVDVYRGEVSAQKRLINYMLFVSCFHQLVAGPIVRYSHVAREIEQRVFNLQEFIDGSARFCKGLFKKVLIANIAGELAQQFLGRNLAEATLTGQWFGLLMYSLQIYFDFSGYSDMAIGLGWMFGFRYQENFRHPYIAQSITDFWRRWHISLGTLFRDYVYIPLGGNRQYQTRNIFIVWALTGLWHGASWNFVLWGLYFGTILWLEKLFILRWLGAVPAFAAHVYTLSLIVVGWAIFYFTDLYRLAQSFEVLFRIARVPVYDFEVVTAFSSNVLWLAFACVACTPVYTGLHARLEQHLRKGIYNMCLLGQSLAFLSISVILLVGKTYNPFIYFRF